VLLNDQIYEINDVPKQFGAADSLTSEAISIEEYGGEKK